MAERGNPRLEAGLSLDHARQRVAYPALGELDVAERICLPGSTGLLLELRDVGAFGDHDDAEELAFPAAPVEMPDDVPQRERELGNDDQVSSAGHPAEERHPSRGAA